MRHSLSEAFPTPTPTPTLMPDKTIRYGLATTSGSDSALYAGETTPSPEGQRTVCSPLTAIGAGFQVIRHAFSKTVHGCTAESASPQQEQVTQMSVQEVVALWMDEHVLGVIERRVEDIAADLSGSASFEEVYGISTAVAAESIAKCIIQDVIHMLSMRAMTVDGKQEVLNSITVGEIDTMLARHGNTVLEDALSRKDV